jgi:hypothetical protein
MAKKAKEADSKSDIDKMISGLDVNTDLAIDESMFDGLDDDQEDPLENLERTGNVIEDSKPEISETLKAFKAAANNETKTFEDNTDTEFWFTVVFQNRAQKDAFLEKTGWVDNHDKYLDGEVLAETMGIELPDASPRFIEEETEKRMAALPRIREKPLPTPIKLN